MSKNVNFTLLDANQVINRKFDSEHDADRVVIVGSDLKVDMQTDGITQAIQEGFKDMQLNSQLQTVEKIVFLPQIEIREIEKQIFIPVIEYRTIEIPVITERIVTIEKPVIITEYKEKEVFKERYYPTVLKVCAIIQAMGVVALLIINLLKK
jgi:hypothetical protein